MTIVDQVQEALKEHSSRTPNRDSQKLAEFYEEMKREGMIIKKEYDLPPIDSIGRHRSSVEIKYQRRQK